MCAFLDVNVSFPCTNALRTEAFPCVRVCSHCCVTGSIGDLFDAIDEDEELDSDDKMRMTHELQGIFNMAAQVWESVGTHGLAGQALGDFGCKFEVQLV